MLKEGIFTLQDFIKENNKVQVEFMFENVVDCIINLREFTIKVVEKISKKN